MLSSSVELSRAFFGDGWESSSSSNLSLKRSGRDGWGRRTSSSSESSSLFDVLLRNLAVKFSGLVPRDKAEHELI